MFLKRCEELHIAQFKDDNIIDKIETTTDTALLQEYEVVFEILHFVLSIMVAVFYFAEKMVQVIDRTCELSQFAYRVYCFKNDVH